MNIAEAIVVAAARENPALTPKAGRVLGGLMAAIRVGAWPVDALDGRLRAALAAQAINRASLPPVAGFHQAVARIARFQAAGIAALRDDIRSRLIAIAHQEIVTVLTTEWTPPAIPALIGRVLEVTQADWVTILHAADPIAAAKAAEGSSLKDRILSAIADRIGTIEDAALLRAAASGHDYDAAALEAARARTEGLLCQRKT